MLFGILSETFGAETTAIIFVQQLSQNNKHFSMKILINSNYKSSKPEVHFCPTLRNWKQLPQFVSMPSLIHRPSMPVESLLKLVCQSSYLANDTFN